MTPRKGARRRSDVTAEVLAALNAGILETASLPEALSVDFAALLRAVCPDVPGPALATLDPALGVTRRMALAARLLHDHLGPDAFDRCRAHPSDTVRGWAAYVLAERTDLDLKQTLRLVRPLADDPHFGVREWAWIAIRPRLADRIESAVAALVPWVRQASPNVRRFAVEITRPRGVWCCHLEALKQRPELGLRLLEPVNADPARYVQDSVANWLNDASKSRPDWVRLICESWSEGSPVPATQRICKRALRSLEPEG